MAAEVKKEIQLEIAHVVFTDIVGYSKLPIHQQRALVERLNEIVRGTDEYQAAEKGTWLAPASIWHSGSWTAAMPDTSCCRSMSLKTWRNTLTGSRTCMNLASVK